MFGEFGLVSFCIVFILGGVVFFIRVLYFVIFKFIFESFRKVKNKIFEEDGG